MVERLKYGATRNMSPEEFKEYKRSLQRRWKAKNPERIKEDNRKWWEWRKREKPKVCVCKYCGNEFNAARATYKICPECLEKPCPTKVKLWEAYCKRLEKQQKINEVRELYSTGQYKQKQLAYMYNVSQRVISYWVRGRK